MEQAPEKDSITPMEQIRATFRQCQVKGRAALVTFVTAGYPTIKETPDIMLKMQAGGADIIELGIPFTDPSADGPTIQKASQLALLNGVTICTALQMVHEARQKGLQVPVVLMSYYNPILCYGEAKLIEDCKKAGVNGFLIVDLPPEESVEFRELCKGAGLSYVPLIAPCTSDNRIKLLCEAADTFVYVVSKMGVTGAAATLNQGLSDIMERVLNHSIDNDIFAAVGFGINTRDHFMVVSGMADGVVIGSKIISVLTDAPTGEGALRVKEYCSYITERDLYEVPTTASLTDRAGPTFGANPGPVVGGTFGGRYVPEVMTEGLMHLEWAFNEVKDDPSFWEEIQSHYAYMNRPSKLHTAEHLTKFVGGANIWLKREDLNLTGSYKINNAMAQILLARRLKKRKIIAETASGQHGLAVATLCSKFNLECTIFMGAFDARRQQLNFYKMKFLGANVVLVESGSGTLRDVTAEAQVAFIGDLQGSYYVVGSTVGPHPIPTIVRTFQSVIGDETKDQFREMTGRLPDAVVACVGSGANAAGMFHPFISMNEPVRVVGVEAAGNGLNTAKHSASLMNGSIGVFNGARTYVLQNSDGQISTTHSIAAGLDYPAVGPELASWKATGKATFVTATDKDAAYAYILMGQLEDIFPGLEAAHAIAGAIRIAKELGEGKDVVVCLSGDGEKDTDAVADMLPALGSADQPTRAS